MAFQFDAATHAYTLDGVQIPSVTRSLDHAGLVSYDMVRQDVLERRSEIGTKAHQACHYYDDGDLDVDTLDHRIRGHVEAWAKFRSDTGFVPRLIEKRYVATLNGMTVGLTVDREGLFRKQEAIIEIKTSTQQQNWWRAQLAGYALGVPDFDGLILSPLALFLRRRRIAVQLFESGKYRKFDYAERNDAQLFLSALHITTWKMQHGSKIRRIEE